MSPRNKPWVLRAFFSLSVRCRTFSKSSTLFRRLLNCQRQSFHFSSGTSVKTGARLDINGVGVMIPLLKENNPLRQSHDEVTLKLDAWISRQSPYASGGSWSVRKKSAQ